MTRNVQFTVMTDRSQGGSSLNDGQLELMVCGQICVLAVKYTYSVFHAIILNTHILVFSPLSTQV